MTRDAKGVCDECGAEPSEYHLDNCSSVLGHQPPTSPVSNDQLETWGLRVDMVVDVVINDANCTVIKGIISKDANDTVLVLDYAHMRTTVPWLMISFIEHVRA